MGIKVEFIIYIYVCVCICMIIFNCFFIIYRRRKHIVLGIRSRKVQDIIYVQLEYMRLGKEISTYYQNILAKKLVKVQHLSAFNNIVEPLIERGDAFTLKYLTISRTVFSYLAIKYQEQSSMKKAFFSYLMSQYKISKGMHFDIITDIMISFITDDSVYCRENALRALYSFGNADSVVKALLLMTQNRIFHSKKLIADGLASFEGEHSQLTARLWERFEDFDTETQIGIVNYINIASDAYCECFHQALTKSKTDKEVKLAIIRYFRKYYYEPIYEQLISYLAHEEKYDWEYSAVAALSLQRYPGRKTIDALKSAIFSSNWYIRFNSAESLVAYKINIEEFDAINDSNDLYAKEMLQFKLKESQERKGR